MSRFKNCIKKFAAAILLAVVCLAASPSATLASDYECYGAFSVCNPTTVHIYYQVRWGSGEWDETCLAPGETMVHFEEVDEDGCINKREIRFDAIAGDDCVAYKTLAPKVYQAHCTDDAKPYHFKLSPCGTKLSLFASDEQR